MTVSKTAFGGNEVVSILKRAGPQSSVDEIAAIFTVPSLGMPSVMNPRYDVALGTNVSVQPKTKTPAWWQQEDWMAVWLGGFFLVAVLLGLRLPLPAFKWSDSASLGTIASSGVLGQLALICGIYLATSLPGAVALGAKAGRYVTGFPFVFVLAWLAQVAAGNATANYWGIEYVIFALILGLFVSNVIGRPAWLQEAVRTEYYIKTGLVIMGATILFQEIMTAGALGCSRRWRLSL